MYYMTFIYDGGSMPGKERRVLSTDLAYTAKPNLLSGIDVDDGTYGVLKNFSKDKIRNLKEWNVVPIKEYCEDIESGDIVDEVTDLMQQGRIVHADGEAYVVTEVATKRKDVVVLLEKNVFAIVGNVNTVSKHKIEIQKGSISNPSVTIAGEGTQYNSTHNNTVTELYDFLCQLKKEGYF